MCCLKDYTEKIRILDELHADFIAGLSIKTVLGFLRTVSDKNDYLASVYMYLVKAEVENTNAKRSEFADDMKMRHQHYMIKHDCIQRAVIALSKWNNLNKDKLILYGYSVDYEVGLPVIYFNLPDTEQISFHDKLKRELNVPEYPFKWDGLENTTLLKLRQGIINRYHHLLKKKFPFKSNDIAELEINLPEEISQDDEIAFKNMRQMLAMTENPAAKEEYIRQKFCDGLGLIDTLHQIVEQRKKEQDAGCPKFVTDMLKAEYNRTKLRKAGYSGCDSGIVNSLINTLKNAKRKHKLEDVLVSVKKVHSEAGKYLVEFDVQTERGGLLQTSLYSTKTPLTKDSPEWIVRERNDAREPLNNVENLERFIKNYI